MAGSRRDHLVDVALKLFCKQGFRATGIDNVLAESGVAKKTLYNHFKSKDELIIAALKKRDQDFFNDIALAMDQHLTSAVSAEFKLMAFFDALDDWINSSQFNGCTFINASAEFPRREDPIHIACEDHKKRVLVFIEALIADLNKPVSKQLAKQITLLVEGAIVLAHTAGDKTGAVLAKSTTEQLLHVA